MIFLNEGDKPILQSSVVVSSILLVSDRLVVAPLDSAFGARQLLARKEGEKACTRAHWNETDQSAIETTTTNLGRAAADGMLPLESREHTYTGIEEWPKTVLKYF